jgi:hypothetical protein
MERRIIEQRATGAVSIENPANQGQAVRRSIPRFMEVESKSQ